MDRARQPEEPSTGNDFMIPAFCTEGAEVNLLSLGSMPHNAAWWKQRVRRRGGPGPFTSVGWVTLSPVLKAHGCCSHCSSALWKFSRSISHFMLTIRKEIHCLIRLKSGILENRRNLLPLWLQHVSLSPGGQALSCFYCLTQASFLASFAVYFPSSRILNIQI